MTDASDPNRFRFLATYIAGPPVDVTETPGGQPAHTNGQFIFVSAGGSVGQQRREMLVQAALLGAGSLDPPLVKRLRARATVARRYLTLEGDRVLTELARQIPLDAALLPAGQPSTSTAEESLEVAKSRAIVADPPEWFGVIKPTRPLGANACPGGQATNKDLRLQFDPIDMPESEDDEDEDDDGGKSSESKILKLFSSPLFNNQSMSDYFRKMFGGKRSGGEGAAGAEMTVRSIRRVQEAGANAPPLPTRIQFTDDGKPGAAVGVRPARRIGCCSSFRTAFPTTTATKAGTRRRMPARPSRNFAQTALPVFVYPSALPRKPMCWNGSSAPPASRAPRPWPT